MLTPDIMPSKTSTAWLNAFGIIDRKLHSTLTTIRRIRNEFAHPKKPVLPGSPIKSTSYKVDGVF